MQSLKKINECYRVDNANHLNKYEICFVKNILLSFLKLDTKIRNYKQKIKFHCKFKTFFS